MEQSLQVGVVLAAFLLGEEGLKQVFLVLLKVIFYFHPYLGAFWGLFYFSRLLKQIQVFQGQQKHETTCCFSFLLVIFHWFFLGSRVLHSFCQGLCGCQPPRRSKYQLVIFGVKLKTSSAAEVFVDFLMQLFLFLALLKPSGRDRLF